MIVTKPGASGMTAREFIAKWSPGGGSYSMSERAGAQLHFTELCQVLGVPTPNDAETYTFERGLNRTGSGTHHTNGFADVWLKGHFAWEYKAPGKSLDVALRQLMQYALPLESPPLLVVSDRLRIEVHTHFTGTPSEKHVFLLEDMGRSEVQARLRQVWQQPDTFKPRRTNRDITEEAASTFAGTADRLRAAGTPGEQVSHFLTQCLFCFFAEDVGLLPDRLFERLVGVNISPERMRAQLQALLTTMRDGGLFGVDDIPWFNGGLFRDVTVPPLSADDVAALKAASRLNWSAIDPSIFGTLFERGLDPTKRSQLGAHYTDPATIMRLVEPVVLRPLLDEWKEARQSIAAQVQLRDQLRTEAQAIPSTTKVLKDKFARIRTKANESERAAQARFGSFLERLRAYRVLDPACGSGNFLYLALKALKDLEHHANLEAEELGLQRQHDVTGPHNVYGIELNEYAAELARVTIWIGELQWRIQRGYGFKLNPILEPLEHIQCRDALMAPDGSEATWPAADAIVGNPPFVGDKKMRGELGDAYTERLRAAYKGRVPGGADLVCYWFEKARAQIEVGGLQRAGLVATNSIRQGANREVLHRVLTTARIFETWADEPWVNNGAAVRVSLVAFGHSKQAARLDGKDVAAVYADLKAVAEGADAMDLTTAQPLKQNEAASYFGYCLAGPFTVEPAIARGWLGLPNPNARSNADVLAPIWNGADITRRPADRWVVDFGATMNEGDAALFEAPFAHVERAVKPMREGNRETNRAARWWLHGRARPELRRAGAGLARWIVTSETAKHRYFVWLPRGVAPEHKLVVFPRADEATFGLLSSRLHALWAVSTGGHLGVGNDPVYSTGKCFVPFPFPAGLTPADTAHQRTEALPSPSPQPSTPSGTEPVALIPAGLAPPVRAHAEAIALAAHRLVALRDAWLNPPEWTERVPEVVPLGMAASPYPDRIVAKVGHEAELAKRTLTNLYNTRPAWLAQAHEALDAAVAAAYGWADYSPAMPDDEILRRLLALNLVRAAG